jgi:hypothetical protein
MKGWNVLPLVGDKTSILNNHSEAALSIIARTASGAKRAEAIQLPHKGLDCFALRARIDRSFAQPSPSVL